MGVILLSIGSYTFASSPEETIWLDVWINLSSGSVIEGSTDHQAQIEGASLSDSPRLTTSKIDESRAPFAQIEAFCIAVFTLEYLLRLFASPQGPGVCKFLRNVWNIVDLVAIIPFYIEWVMELLNSKQNLGYLSVLRLFRLTRITRVFKMSKNLEGLVLLNSALRKSGPALLMLFAFMVRPSLPAMPPPAAPPRAARRARGTRCLRITAAPRTLHVLTPHVLPPCCVCARAGHRGRAIRHAHLHR